MMSSFYDCRKLPRVVRASRLGLLFGALFAAAIGFAPAPAAAQTTPAAVTPAATSIGETNINVEWTKITDATSYHLRWRETDVTPVAWMPDADGQDVGDVAAHDITGLTANTSYTYELRGANDDGNGAWTGGDATATTLAAFPVMFGGTSNTVAENDASAVVITVQIGTAPDADQDITFTTGGTATSPSDYTITASPITIAGGATSATIRITIVNDAIGETFETLTVTLTDGVGYSLANSATTYTLTITDNDAPAKITILDSTNGGSNHTRIVALWNIPTSTLATNPYDVRYRVKTPQGPWTFKSGTAVGATAGNALCLTPLASNCRRANLTDLTGPGATYEFQVRARGSGKTGEWSDPHEQVNSGTATTADALTNLSGAGIGGGAELRWSIPTGVTIAAYRVRYRLTDADGAGSGTDPGVWQGWVHDATQAATPAPAITDDASGNGFAIELGQLSACSDDTSKACYSLLGLEPNTSYDMSVAAIIGETLGAWATETAATALAATDPPTKITTLGSRGGSATTSIVALWNVPTGTLVADSYDVRYRVKTPLGPWTTIAGDDLGDTAGGALCLTPLASNCRRANLTGLTGPGATYEFQVRARNSHGAGEWSQLQAQVNTGSATTAAALTNLSGESISGGVELSWTIPTGITIAAYRVRYRTAAIDATDPDGTPNSGDETAAVAAGVWQGWVNDAGATASPAPMIADDASGNGFAIGLAEAAVCTDDASKACYSLTGFPVSSTYDISVAAILGETLGTWATDITVEANLPTAIPLDPAAPTASAATSTGFTVEWVRLTTATNYHVRWRTAGATAWLPAVEGFDAGNVAAYPITGLTPSTSYEYELRAGNQIGLSPNWVAGEPQGTLPTVDFTTTARTVTESVGTVTIIAELSGAVPTATTIAYTMGGTATLTTDYTLAPASLVVPANTTTADLTITLTGDATHENDETLTITLAAGTGYEVAATDNVYTLTITDDDVLAKFAAAGQPRTSDTEAILIGWDVPDGDLDATNPYEVRHRVKSPLTAWTLLPGTSGTPLGDTASTACSSFSLNTGCRELVVDNLAAGVTYEFQVRAQGAAGFSPWSDLAEQTNNGTLNNTSATPATITATATQNGASIIWTAPASSGTINDYRIRYRTAETSAGAGDAGAWQGWIDAPNLDDSPIIGDSNDGFGVGLNTPITVTLADLAGGVEHDVAVAVVVGQVIGPWTTATTVTPAAPTVAPADPAAPTASAVTSTGLTVGWTKVTGAATYFVRYRVMGTTAWTPDADGTDAGNVAAHPITGLDPSTTYEYELQARNSVGPSPTWVAGEPQSTLPTVDFTTTTSSGAEGEAITITAELSGAVATDTTLTLATSGTAASNDYTLAPLPFVISMGATTADLTISLTDDPTGESTEMLIITIDPSPDYELVANADTTHTLTITDNDVPTKITAVGGQPNMGDNAAIFVGFDTPAGDLIADPYEIRYRVKSPLGVWATQKVADSSITQPPPEHCDNFIGLSDNCNLTTITGLNGPGVTYEFQIRAASAAGNSEWSKLVTQANNGSAATGIAAPTAFTALPAASGATLAWVAPSSGTILDYRVRYRTAAIDATDPDGTPNSGDETAAVAAGVWQGWIDAPDLDDSPILGDNANGNGFAIGQTTTTYVLAGLMPATLYDVGVAAIVSEVRGAWAAATVTPALASVRPVALAAPPTAGAEDIESFTVSWQSVTGAAEYHVRWRTANPRGAWQNANGANNDGEVVSTGFTYTITGLTHNTRYDYQVRASNHLGNSGWTGGVAHRTARASAASALTGITLGGSGTATSALLAPSAFEAGAEKYTVSAGASGGTVIFTATISDKATAVGTISNDTNAADAALSGANATGTITLNTVTLTPNLTGIVEYTLTVTAEDESTTPYVFDIVTGPTLSTPTLTDAAEDGIGDIPLTPTTVNPFDYTATTVPYSVSAVELTATWTGIDNSVVALAAGETIASGIATNPIELAVGANEIELQFGGGADHGMKDPVIYTIRIFRAPLTDIEELTEKAESVAKSVSAAVVLSGVLDAVSQNAFDATGSFTPFVDVGARNEQGTRQALVPAARQVAAPLLLSEQPQPRDADWRELLGASAFRLGLNHGGARGDGSSGGALGGGTWSVWGSGDVRGFNGGGDVETEGLGYSVYLGTDYKKGNWLAGIAAGYSSTTADTKIDGDTTKSEFWLAGGYPYLRYSWQNQVDAWLLLGAGGGQLTLKDAEDASAFVVSHLYAAGAKANVLRAGRLSLAAKADVAANFALSVSTDNLNDFDTMQQRVRVGVDAAYDYRGATHGLRPHLEVGARLDFGAGESDIIAGAEVAGGIRYEFQPLRLSIDARGRALVYDTTGLLREWGAGATIRMTPKANGEGISASLTPGWGAPQSRVDNMWQDNTPALTQSQTLNQALSLRGELAYTFRHKDARITPLTQYSLNAQSQTIGIGTRLNLAPLSLELLGERIDHTTNPDNYRLRLNSTFRF